MRVDRRLNLVIPVVDDAGKPFAYVHSTPISTDTFDTYFLPLARTYSALVALGLGPIAGPKIADKLLKKTSIELKMWETSADGTPGVKAGLISEIHRLTNVVAVGKNGWETLPYAVAKQQGILNSSDAAEVDSAIVFFIVSSAMVQRSDLKAYLEGVAELWNAQIESLNVTEFMNSLPTPTTNASTGATQVT